MGTNQAQYAPVSTNKRNLWAKILLTGLRLGGYSSFRSDLYSAVTRVMVAILNCAEERRSERTCRSLRV